MSQRRDSNDSTETDVQSPEPALRALVRLLGRQAARDVFARASSPDVEPQASEMFPACGVGGFNRGDQ